MLETEGRNKTMPELEFRTPRPGPAETGNERRLRELVLLLMVLAVGR